MKNDRKQSRTIAKYIICRRPATRPHVAKKRKNRFKWNVKQEPEQNNPNHGLQITGEKSNSSMRNKQRRTE